MSEWVEHDGWHYRVDGVLYVTKPEPNTWDSRVRLKIGYVQNEVYLEFGRLDEAFSFIDRIVGKESNERAG